MNLGREVGEGYHMQTDRKLIAYFSYGNFKTVMTHKRYDDVRL